MTMKKNKIALTLLALAGFTGLANAQSSFSIRVPVKETLSNYVSSETLYQPWSNSGDHYACQMWTPEQNTIPFGESFLQERSCKQDQSRTAVIQERDSFSDKTRVVREYSEDRTITEEERRNSVGTYQNWVSYDSTFTDWTDTGEALSHGSWSPEPSTQTEAFAQVRTYKQPQERMEQRREVDTVTGDIRDIGEPLLHTQQDNRSESRTIDVTWSEWSDTSRDGVGEWSPVSYNEIADFQQTREYGQNQIRDRIYSLSGLELSRFEESRLVSPLYESRTVTVASSAWADTMRSGHTSWTPAATTQTSDFIQSRTYIQHQSKTWTYKADGAEISTRVENRAVANQTETQTVEVSWTPWVDSGSVFNCGSWTPDATTIANGQSFTQNRNCSKNQTRNRTYKIGSTVVTTQIETNTVSTTQSQSAIGAGKIWRDMGQTTYQVEGYSVFSTDPKWNFGDLAGTTQYEYYGYMTYGSSSDIGKTCSNSEERRAYGSHSCEWRTHYFGSNSPSSESSWYTCKTNAMVCR